MKKIIFVFISVLLSGSTFAQFGRQERSKNPLLNADFWEANPSLTAVKAEITKGNDPGEKNRMQFDVPYIAITNGAPYEIVKYLIEQPGGDVNKLGHEKLTYVHAAASKGDVQLLNYLIAKGAKIDVETDFGMVPIVSAASNGQNDPAVYETFFKAGISPKQKYANGANLLLLGIANDQDLKLSNYLTSKGLSLNDVDNEGRTAFDYAAKGGNIELLKTLNAKSIKHTGNALLMAAQGSRRKANTIEVYQYLVDELKINPAATNKDGENVLHAVVRKPEQEEIIKYFIGKGVDVNQPDNDGNSAFMNAAAGKNTAVVELLLPYVKNINTVNAKGESALTMSVKSGSSDVISLLLKKGADIQIINKEGNNLAYALVQAHRARGWNRDGDDTEEKLQMLKKSGLNITAPQKDGGTLYHIAASKNDLVALKSLAGLGINLNAKNAEGMTALQKASLVAKNDEVLKYLISLGADKSIKTDMGETAYDLAKDNDYLSKNNVSVDFLR